MATNTLTNVDFLNALRTTASQDYQNRIPVATRDNLKLVADSILDYPTSKNEFIGVLTNLVGKTVFLNKLYTNPYKFFKQGALPYGKTIESIFIDLIQAKTFNENFGDSQASSLIGVEKPNNVKVEYYSENFKNKYKISVSDSRLRGAIRSENGLSELTQMLLVAPLNSAEVDEFLMIKKVMNTISMKTIELTGYSALKEDEQAKKLTKTIKTYINKFNFISNQYNKQGVMTFAKPNEIVVFVTPETKANIDVELLSSSFNMSKADIESRLIMIDEFSKVVGEEETIDTDTLAIVCDEKLVQFYETENSSESFRNPDQLTTNIFTHRWGILCGCGFVNAIKIKNKSA